MEQNGKGKIPATLQDNLPKLAAEAATAARAALIAADRVATALVTATNKDADTTVQATEEHEDQIQDAGTDMLIAGALLQTHGWWLPENIEGLATIIKNAERSTRNERNEAVAQLVLDHCNWMERTKRRLDRETDS